MLTAFELGNFKGDSACRRVVFGRVRLLFVTSGADKLFILQALLYVRKLLHRAELVGGVLGLGRVPRLVHFHDLHVELAAPGELDRFGGETIATPFPDLAEVDSASLEFETRAVATASFRWPKHVVNDGSFERGDTPASVRGSRPPRSGARR